MLSENHILMKILIMIFAKTYIYIILTGTVDIVLHFSAGNNWPIALPIKSKKNYEFLLSIKQIYYVDILQTGRSPRLKVTNNRRTRFVCIKKTCL